MTTESLQYFMKYFTHITYIALSIYYVVRAGVMSFRLKFGTALQVDTDENVVFFLKDVREKKRTGLWRANIEAVNQGYIASWWLRGSNRIEPHRALLG